MSLIETDIGYLPCTTDGENDGESPNVSKKKSSAQTFALALYYIKRWLGCQEETRNSFALDAVESGLGPKSRGGRQVFVAENPIPDSVPHCTFTPDTRVIRQLGYSALPNSTGKASERKRGKVIFHMHCITARRTCQSIFKRQEIGQSYLKKEAEPRSLGPALSHIEMIRCKRLVLFAAYQHARCGQGEAKRRQHDGQRNRDATGGR